MTANLYQNASTCEPKSGPGAKVGKVCVFCCDLLYFGATGPSKRDQKIDEKRCRILGVVLGMVFKEKVPQMASNWVPNGTLELTKMRPWSPMGAWGAQGVSLGGPRGALGPHLGSFCEHFVSIVGVFCEYCGSTV